MNIETTLSVYYKAEKRFNAGTGTKADEVLLALWDELKAKAKVVREQAAEIDMLKMVRDGDTRASSPEFTSMMGRMSVKTTLLNA